MSESLPDNSWCHSVGLGWQPLVRAIEQIAEAHEYHISDVKEKFGTLRVYCTAPEWFQDFVDACEAASAHICEQCGKYGEQDTLNGWAMTLCEQCGDERREVTRIAPNPPK